MRATPFLASSGMISGGGFAMAKTIASSAIVLTISAVTIFGADTPTKISLPFIAAEESMAALKGFYKQGSWIWGKYGFYDAFSPNEKWTVPHYLAIDQCTIAPMIENHRTGLLWRLFMSCPEIQDGLKKLGFTSTTAE